LKYIFADLDFNKEGNETLQLKAMFWQNQPLSSSDEDHDDSSRRDDYTDYRRTTPFRSSHGGYRSKVNRTPLTVLKMTPSPVQSPLIADISPIANHSFSSTQQQIFLDQSMPTPTAVLFPDSTPTKRRRKKSNRQSKLSDSLHLEDSSFDRS